MSQTIKWGVITPPEPAELKLGHVSPDSLIFILHKAFGEFPVCLTKDNIERLEGIKACYEMPNVWGDIIIVIKRYGPIRIYAETAE